MCLRFDALSSLRADPVVALVFLHRAHETVFGVVPVVKTISALDDLTFLWAVPVPIHDDLEEGLRLP